MVEVLVNNSGRTPLHNGLSHSRPQFSVGKITTNATQQAPARIVMLDADLFADGYFISILPIIGALASEGLIGLTSSKNISDAQERIDSLAQLLAQHDIDVHPDLIMTPDQFGTESTDKKPDRINQDSPRKRTYRGSNTFLFTAKDWYQAHYGNSLPRSCVIYVTGSQGKKQQNTTEGGSKAHEPFPLQTTTGATYGPPVVPLAAGSTAQLRRSASKGDSLSAATLDNFTVIALSPEQPGLADKQLAQLANVVDFDQQVGTYYDSIQPLFKKMPAAQQQAIMLFLTLVVAVNNNTASQKTDASPYKQIQVFIVKQLAAHPKLLRALATHKLTFVSQQLELTSNQALDNFFRGTKTDLNTGQFRQETFVFLWRHFHSFAHSTVAKQMIAGGYDSMKEKCPPLKRALIALSILKNGVLTGTQATALRQALHRDEALQQFNITPHLDNCLKSLGYDLEAQRVRFKAMRAEQQHVVMIYLALMLSLNIDSARVADKAHAFFSDTLNQHPQLFTTLGSLNLQSVNRLLAEHSEDGLETFLRTYHAEVKADQRSAGTVGFLLQHFTGLAYSSTAQTMLQAGYSSVSKQPSAMRRVVVALSLLENKTVTDEPADALRAGLQQDFAGNPLLVGFFIEQFKRPNLPDALTQHAFTKLLRPVADEKLIQMAKDLTTETDTDDALLEKNQRLIDHLPLLVFCNDFAEENPFLYMFECIRLLLTITLIRFSAAFSEQWLRLATNHTLSFSRAARQAPATSRALLSSNDKTMLAARHHVLLSQNDRHLLQRVEAVDGYLRRRAIETRRGACSFFGYSFNDYNKRRTSWIKILDAMQKPGATPQGIAALIRGEAVKFSKLSPFSRNNYHDALITLAKHLEQPHQHIARQHSLNNITMQVILAEKAQVFRDQVSMGEAEGTIDFIGKLNHYDASRNSTNNPSLFLTPQQVAETEEGVSDISLRHAISCET